MPTRIVATHDHELAAQADEVILMHNGKIAAKGKWQELLERSRQYEIDPDDEVGRCVNFYLKNVDQEKVLKLSLEAESQIQRLDAGISQANFTPMGRLRHHISNASPLSQRFKFSLNNEFQNASVAHTPNMLQRRHKLSMHTIAHNLSNQNTPNIPVQRILPRDDQEVIAVPKTAPMTRFKFPEAHSSEKKIEEEEGDDDEHEEALNYQQSYDELMNLLNTSGKDE